jgi:Flp pilus assembly protein CpaB
MKRLCALLVLLGGLGQSLRADEPRLVRIVVAAVDVAAGEPVTVEQLSARGIPAELVTTTMVQEKDVAFVVGQTAQLPLLQGDVLQWSFFETLKTPSTSRCLKGVHPGKTAREQVAHSRQVLLSRSPPKRK